MWNRTNSLVLAAALAGASLALAFDAPEASRPPRHRFAVGGGGPSDRLDQTPRSPRPAQEYTLSDSSEEEDSLETGPVVMRGRPPLPRWVAAAAGWATQPRADPGLRGIDAIVLIL